ncbi:MAG TPA: tetratricopeptide repeat protein [Planococcus sp. (in: firmicutes)]|nr:tetratricopeptide repeat protein [Planococcus sp. (in: firmicutes)]
MRKKYRELKRKGNVIVFPNTVQVLLTEGMNLLKDERYVSARDKLHQVLAYEPEHPGALGAYAYCLFELGEYEEALEVCRELLKVGPVHYLETMELYISILMQVREFGEAERVLEALIEEKVLPDERLEQFQQLRELNERIALNAVPAKIDPTLYATANFVALPPAEQERRVLELPAGSLEVMKGSMIELVQHPETDTLAKTYILFKLHEEKVDAEVRLHKFGFEETYSIRQLPDPVNDGKLVAVKKILRDCMQKDPTRLDMALELFDRHVFLLYPFMWEAYSAEQVAFAYKGYLDGLFSEEAPESVDQELLTLIFHAEQWFELRNG